MVKLPERFNTRMNALDACEHLATDAGVTHVAVLENRPRHRDRPLGVVGGLADAPLVLRIAGVPRDGCSRRSLESTDSVWIPAKNTRSGKGLCLLSDRVTGCDPLQTGKNSLRQARIRSPAVRSISARRAEDVSDNCALKVSRSRAPLVSTKTAMATRPTPASG